MTLSLTCTSCEDSGFSLSDVILIAPCCLLVPRGRGRYVGDEYEPLLPPSVKFHTKQKSLEILTGFILFFFINLTSTLVTSIESTKTFAEFGVGQA